VLPALVTAVKPQAVGAYLDVPPGDGVVGVEQGVGLSVDGQGEGGHLTVFGAGVPVAVHRRGEHDHDGRVTGQVEIDRLRPEAGGGRSAVGNIAVGPEGRLVADAVEIQSAGLDAHTDGGPARLGDDQAAGFAVVQVVGGIPGGLVGLDTQLAQATGRTGRIRLVLGDDAGQVFLHIAHGQALVFVPQHVVSQRRDPRLDVHPKAGILHRDRVSQLDVVQVDHVGVFLGAAQIHIFDREGHFGLVKTVFFDIAGG